MGKSADAFRTISEVADWLETPAHVLRFWESKFSQVKPVKRAGGRRYYRPADMRLLGGIKKLLHDDGMTIKGVQKLLRDQGVKHVSDMAPPLDDGLQDEAGISLDAVDHSPTEGAQVLDFASGAAKPGPSAPATRDTKPNEQPQEPELFTQLDEDDTASSEAEPDPQPAAADMISGAIDNPEKDQPPTPDSTDAPADPTPQDDDAEAKTVPTFSHRSVEDTSGESDSLGASDDKSADLKPESPTQDADAAPPPEPAAPPAPKPQIIDLPDDAPDTVDAGVGALSKLCGLSAPPDADTAKQMEQIADRLRAMIKA